MVLLQFSIGATNDVVDAERDHARRPPKPIPSGLVRRETARAIALAAAASGLVLAASFGVAVLAIAAAGLGCGLAYDLRLSKTPVSWVALAVALPLVPAFSWFGATGGLPARMIPIVLLAMLAGAALAVGNALVDLDADRAMGRRTVAVALGRTRAWAVNAVVLAVVVGWLLATAPDGGGTGPGPAATPALAGAGLVAGGVALMGIMRGAAARAGWALQAMGVAILGVAWVVAATSAR